MAGNDYTVTITEPYNTVEYTSEEPGNCSHLCYDCDSGSYCWDSDKNEDKN